MESINNVRAFEKEPLVFGISLDESSDRLDCVWFNPVINKKIEEIKNKSKNKKSIKLSQVSKISGGKRLPKDTVLFEDENHYIPYVRGVDVKNLKINLGSSHKLTKEIHKTIQNYQLKKNDIVVSIVGTIGNIGMLNQDVEVCDFTENIARLRLEDKKILHKYLLYYLDSDLAKIQFKKFSVGSLQYKLSLNSLRNNINFLVPMENNGYSDKQQQEILNKIETSFFKAEELNRKADNLILEAKNVISKNLKIAVPIEKKLDVFGSNLGGNKERLDALFNNPLLSELKENIMKYDGWDLLENIIDFEKDKKVVPSEFYNLVELRNIDDKIGEIVSFKEVSELGSSKILLKKNTLLISKLQPEQGKIVIVSDKSDGKVASSELIPVKLKSDKVSLEYLWVILRSEYTLKQWAYSLTGSSRMRVGKEEINKTVIPIPNEEVRNKIVSETIGFLTEAKRLKKESNEKKLKAKKDFVNILLN